MWGTVPIVDDIAEFKCIWHFWSTCWGQNILDKYENGFFRTQLDALSNDINKLAYSRVCWD
jgi:hypothetical protein